MKKKIDDEHDGIIDKPNSIKHLYRHSTWYKDYLVFDPEPRKFSEFSEGRSANFFGTHSLECLGCLTYFDHSMF